MSSKRPVTGFRHDEQRTVVTITNIYIYTYQHHACMEITSANTIVGLLTMATSTTLIHIHPSCRVNHWAPSKAERYANYRGRDPSELSNDPPSYLASCSAYLIRLLPHRNNDRREERRYDNRDHCHDNKSKNSRAKQFCHHRPDFRPKISTLLIFYLFMA